MVESSSQHCASCRQHSTRYCTCLPQATFLCFQCVSQHCEQSPGLSHLIHLLTPLGYEVCQAGTELFLSRKQALLSTLVTFDECAQEYDKAISAFVLKITQHRDAALHWLQDRKTQLEIEIGSVVQKVELTLGRETDPSQGYFEQFLRGEVAENLPLLKWDIDMSGLNDNVESSILLECCEPQALPIPAIEVNVAQTGIGSEFKKAVTDRLPHACRELYTSLSNFKFVDQAIAPVKKAIDDEGVYVGDVDSEGRYHGPGVLVKGSLLLEGVWVSGAIHGPGLQLCFNSDYFLGSFSNGELSGDGKFVASAGPIYEGEWLNSMQHGHGTESWPDGAVYTGEFAEGIKEGFGQFIWADGSSYQGEFRRNVIEGKGCYIWGDGRVYEGQWRDSKMNGEGKFTWTDGKMYKGHYVDDMKHGFGVFTWPGGKKYEGQWKDGKMHGQGVFVSVGGARVEGEWERGKRVDNKPANAN